MAVCGRCGGVGTGSVCALCGAALPPESDATVVREWRPDAPPQAWPPQRPAPGVPGQQAWPPAPLSQGPAPAPRQRRSPLPFVAAGLGLALVVLAIWQGPRLLGQLQPRPAGAISATTIRPPSGTTPASPANPTPVAPATVPASPVPTIPAATPTAAAPASVANPAAARQGAYAGLARQVGATKARVWHVTLRFNGTTGTIAYRPDSAAGEVRCAGTLALRPDGSWLERITSGGCDDGGVWSFGGTDPIHGAYADPAGGYGVTGDFATTG